MSLDPDYDWESLQIAGERPALLHALEDGELFRALEKARWGAEYYRMSADASIVFQVAVDALEAEILRRQTL